MNEKPLTKLLWIDLEMTGLNPETDVITEVAAIITDWDFNELASYETGVKHGSGIVAGLLDKSPFWQAADPSDKQAMLELSDNGKTEVVVQQELSALIQQYFGQEQATLAGNSIHQDRRFIRARWSQVENLLHYRMLDVSAWKLVMNNKYQLMYQKKNVHRAMDDIRESIAELKLYMGKIV